MFPRTGLHKRSRAHHLIIDPCCDQPKLPIFEMMFPPGSQPLPGQECSFLWARCQQLTPLILQSFEFFQVSNVTNGYPVCHLYDFRIHYKDFSIAAFSRISNPFAINASSLDFWNGWPVSSFSNALSSDPRTPLARCAQYESTEIRSRRASRSRMSSSGSLSI